ncbi:MAG: hypothetical protein KJP00_15665 [Bacteroidia bacterium]|nr:hypothetical protein [Bacteroidia bacterium]
MIAKDKKHLAVVLRNIARIGSIVIGILVFVFALLSGSEAYGGGLQGIIKNSPNALPWAFFLIVAFAARKWELPAGIIITLFGLGATYFFNFSGPNFFWITFVLTMTITILGLLFIIAWRLNKNKGR